MPRSGTICHLSVFVNWRRAGINIRRPMPWRNTMRQAILIAGAAALAITATALAESPTPLHCGFAPDTGAAFATRPTTEVAQAQVPAYPPAAPTIVIALTAPPAPQTEIPPPAPAPSYVWDPGHW